MAISELAKSLRLVTDVFENSIELIRQDGFRHGNYRFLFMF